MPHLLFKWISAIFLRLPALTENGYFFTSATGSESPHLTFPNEMHHPTDFFCNKIGVTFSRSFMVLWGQNSSISTMYSWTLGKTHK